MKSNISHFSTLPDEAMVTVKTVAALLEQATVTVWRRSKREADFPKPRKFGSRCTRWRAGDVRAFLAGGNAV